MRELVIDVKNVDKEIKKTKKYLKFCDKNNYKIKYKNTNDFWIKNIEEAINIKDISKFSIFSSKFIIFYLLSLPLLTCFIFYINLVPC